MSVAWLATAIAIFLLLQACFGNWRLAALVFLALPAALAGGVLAAFATGGVISLGSLVGFLTVLGVAARNCARLAVCPPHVLWGPVRRPKASKIATVALLS